VASALERSKIDGGAGDGFFRSLHHRASAHVQDTEDQFFSSIGKFDRKQTAGGIGIDPEYISGMFFNAHHTTTDRPVQWHGHIAIHTTSTAVGFDPQGEHSIEVHGAYLDP